MQDNGIVEMARLWVGTPFVHQGRQMGVGTDCVGLVIGVMRELGVQVKDKSGYGMIPTKGLLQKAVSEHLTKIPIDEMREGDVLLMRFLKEPQHVAIYTGDGIIHAYSKIGRCVEHVFDTTWRDRVVAAYRIID